MTSHLLLHFTFIHSHTKNMTSQIRTEWNRRKTGKQKKVGKEHAFSKNWILLNNFFYICYNHLPDSWAFWTSLAILNESQFALTANQTLHTHRKWVDATHNFILFFLSKKWKKLLKSMINVQHCMILHNVMLCNNH